jgi:hypothetical protein
MQPLNLKPTHKLVTNYHQALGQFGQLNIDHETAVRSAFQNKRSGITNDPNRAEDPEYIVRLIGQVITVSLETMKIVQSLPPLLTDHVQLQEHTAC